jgi:two-component system sensor histidine kinase UhpB
MSDQAIVVSRQRRDEALKRKRKRVLFVRNWHLSLFEKVILVNTIMLVAEALAGLWITSHSLEAHHYLIDTGFIVLATILTLLTNIILLRMSFRPLFGLLATIRAVSAGKTLTRATIKPSDMEIAELAQAFNTMLDRLEAARREQTALILQAQEEEQRRLALELHDETGQNLTALLIHAEVLNQYLQALPESAISADARERLDSGLRRLTTLTQNTLENIRMLAQQLRPSVLDDLGLPAAFRWLVEDSRQRLNLTVDLSIEGISETAHTLPAACETALFRIAQESLTNIARHAHAQHASISLLQDRQCVRLQVHDDGCGFDPGAVKYTGSGILGMQERAALPGGTLTISSQPGRGTTVEAILPLPAEHVTPEGKEDNDNGRRIQ